jgi:hypothetical protein
MREDHGWYTECSKCGDTLIGFAKQDYLEHLRANGETLAAKIEEELVVEEPCHEPDSESATKQTQEENHG